MGGREYLLRLLSDEITSEWDNPSYDTSEELEGLQQLWRQAAEFLGEDYDVLVKKSVGKDGFWTPGPRAPDPNQPADPDPSDLSLWAPDPSQVANPDLWAPDPSQVANPGRPPDPPEEGR